MLAITDQTYPEADRDGEAKKGKGRGRDNEEGTHRGQKYTGGDEETDKEGDRGADRYNDTGLTGSVRQ